MYRIQKMVRKKTLIGDKVINELAFDTLFHLSQPDKVHLLSSPELRATKTARAARTFANGMTMDEKMMLFAKIGISYSVVIHNTDWKLKKFFEKYKELTKGQKLADASKTKLIVCNDRVVADFLNMMASITHSDGYILNMDFHRVGHFFNTWKDAAPDADNIAEALDYAKMINKFALVQNMAMKSIRGVTDIGDLDLNILMYLYDAGAKYVTRTILDNYFGAIYKKTLITAAVKRLVEKALIERNPTVRLPEYEITAAGTKSVMDFHTRNLQSV